MVQKEKMVIELVGRAPSIESPHLTRSPDEFER
jgi:hypothetical protein